MAEVTNKSGVKGGLADAMKGADVFIGVSAPNTVSVEMVESMAENAVVFACANPTPEIYPEDALKGGAKVVNSVRYRKYCVNSFCDFAAIRPSRSNRIARELVVP